MREARDRFRLSRLGELIVRFRWAVLALVAVAIALIGRQALSLRDDLSFETLYMSDDPEIAFSDEYNRTFDNPNDMVVVVLSAPQGFTHQLLSAVERITERIDEFENIERVYSLGNARYIQGRGDQLDIGEFMEEVPSDAEALAKLRVKAMAYGLYRRRLLSEDGGYLAVVAQTADVFENREERRSFLDGLEREIGVLVPPGCRHYVTGTNVVEKEYAKIIARDRNVFTLLSLLVIVVAFALMFRSLLDTLVALTALTASGTISLGLIHMMGGTIDIVSSVIMTMILVVGSSDAVHMVEGFYEAWRREPTGRGAASRMVGGVGFACLVTSLTTMLGFGSLYFARIGTINRFGLNMVVSIAVTYVVSLAVITSLLSFRRSVPASRRRESQAGSVGRLLAWFANLVILRWRLVLVGCGLFVVLGAVGLSRLEVDTYAVSEVEESHPIKIAIRKQENLAGFLGFEVSVQAPDAASMLKRETLEKVDRLAAFVDSRPETIVTWSVIDYLKEMNRAANGGGQQHYAVPVSPAACEQYMLLYSFSPEGGKEMNALVSSDRSRLRVISRVHDIGAGAYLKLTADVEREAGRLFAETEAKGRVTGEMFLLHRAMDRIVADMAQSIALAFVFVFVAMIFSLGSWRMGLLSIVPNILPIMATLAFMGLAGISLRVGTVVVFSLGLGIAVDDTVHYFLRFNRETAAGADYPAAVAAAHQGVGRPILFTSVVLIAGFLATVPAEFISLSQMGILNSFTLAAALVADLTVGPVLLRLAVSRKTAPKAAAEVSCEVNQQGGI
jgi:uncharacterized protein